MNRSSWSIPHITAITLVGGVALAGGVWAMVRWSSSPEENAVNLPQELTVASLTKLVQENPDKLSETMMNTFRRDDLTEEQRRQVRRNIGQIWRSRLDKSVEEYFSASEQEKTAVLDRQIDAWQKQMERWRQMRRQREAARKERGEKGGQDESWQERRRRWAQSQTRQQRKARSEGRDPDAAARRRAYFAAVRKRAQQRGIEMPGGRGFRSGRRGGRGP